MENKVTKKVILNAIKVAAENGADFGNVEAKDVIAYVDKTVAQLDAKAEKAKEYGAKKRAEGDALYGAVVDAVGAEYKTIDEITEVVKDAAEDVTRAKVVARLTKAVKEGKAFKAQVKVEGKKVTVYATEPIEVAEADAE
jgi:hypothetical protein